LSQLIGDVVQVCRIECEKIRAPENQPRCPKDKLDWLPSPAIGLETEEALLALVEVRDLARGGGGPLGLIVQDDDQIEVRQSIGGTLLEIGPLPRMQQTAG
jgi:hypothetical protein